MNNNIVIRAIYELLEPSMQVWSKLLTKYIVIEFCEAHIQAQWREQRGDAVVVFKLLC